MFTKYKDYIIREFSSFGFNVEFEERAEVKHSKIASAFIKANTFDQMILIEVPGKMMSDLRKNNLITIKLKVDTNSPAGFSTEMKYLFSPVQYAVRMYSTRLYSPGKCMLLCSESGKLELRGVTGMTLRGMCPTTRALISGILKKECGNQAIILMIRP